MKNTYLAVRAQGVVEGGFMGELAARRALEGGPEAVLAAYRDDGGPGGEGKLEAEQFVDQWLYHQVGPLPTSLALYVTFSTIQKFCC